MFSQTTDQGAKLHALFPTLVYQANLNDRDNFAAAFSENLEAFRFNPSVRNSARYNAGEYHGQILLHQSEPLRSFFNTLAEETAAYLRVLGMKPELFNMQCLKSWFVLCEPEPEASGTAMVAHNHSCSDVSWVYYPDVADDCPPITFHAASRLNTQPFDSAFHYDWHNEQKSAVSTINGWNSDTWSVHPKSGDVLIFPGHQLHSVEANTTDRSRISVAGDIALTLKPEHKNLEFGRTDAKHWLTLPLAE
jgi:uncharacterized protein (TIGR02466 family)